MNTTNNVNESFGVNPVIEDAIEFSEGYTLTYLQEHVSFENGFDERNVTQLACARLQWALEKSRRRISGIFSEADFMTLLDCNQDSFFAPDSFCSIPSILCDHHGISLDGYEATHLKALVNKLRDLDELQCFALGDAMEQAWHRGLDTEQTTREFLQACGIELV